MSEHLTVPQLRRTTQLTQELLLDLAGRPPFESPEQAYSVLRAVLHAVRDRLTVEEATHLAAQLPMLVRGFYYEGWRPALAPNEFETAEAFFRRVEESLGGAPAATEVDVRDGTRAVLEFLVDRMDPGEMSHVIGQLPSEIQELFPESVSG
jgi:uncharacterized protein (DUF2267 family)